MFDIKSLLLYCVSLESSKDRRSHMQKEFFRAGFSNYQFWNALTPTSTETKEYFAQEKVKTFPPCFRCGEIVCNCENNYLQPTQVANFLSFIHIFKYIAENGNEPFYLICEDDIIFFDEHIELFNRELQQGYLEKLSYNEQDPLLIRLGSPYQIAEIHKEIVIQKDLFIPSNTFFMINKAFATCIVDAFTHIETTSDMFIHRDIGLTVQNSTCVPALVQDASFTSSTFPSAIRPRKVLDENITLSNIDSLKIMDQQFEQYIGRIHTSDFLIVGHPREGLGDIVTQYQAFTLDVGEYNVKSNGVASWFFAVEDDIPQRYFEQQYSKYSQNRKDNYFKYIVEVVRNPLYSLPLIMIENKYQSDSYQYRRRHILYRYNIDLDNYPNPLAQAIVSLYYWHKIIETQHPNLIITQENSLDGIGTFLHTHSYINTITRMKCRRKQNNMPMRQMTQWEERLLSLIHLEELSSYSDSIQHLLDEFCDAYDYPHCSYHDVYAHIHTTITKNKINHGKPTTTRKKKTIYVHIGMNKAGTTFLQEILHKNISFFAEQGLAIPQFPMRGEDDVLSYLFNIPLARYGMNGTPILEYDKYKYLLDAVLQDFQYSDADRIIFSEEELFVRNKKNLFAFINDNQEQYDIKIICFIREIISYIVSLWSFFAVRGLFSISPSLLNVLTHVKTYIATGNMEHQYYDQIQYFLGYFHGGMLLDELQDMLGSDSVIVKAYGKNNSIEQDFFDILNITISSLHIPTTYINKAFNLKQSEEILAMNTIFFHKTRDAEHHHMIDYIRSLYKDYDNTLTTSELSLIYELFREQELKITKTFLSMSSAEIFFGDVYEKWKAKIEQNDSIFSQRQLVYNDKDICYRIMADIATSRRKEYLLEKYYISRTLLSRLKRILKIIFVKFRTILARFLRHKRS